uniref:Flavin-containing monooxygenase n=1 Tax=Nelumbo nucifera TaxID=4432 RepID=A0A822XID8_NELNU|nr:TPA_asm: hypothetical protein HUJ06_020018 [Nelumbo nucifera]
MDSVMARSLKVAVIGAGAAGLVAARELQREGHLVVVFEKNSKLGGTWVYDPRVETDPLSLGPRREIVQSSLYSSLRTNLPRQIMGFLDYPFQKRENGGDVRTFPGHQEVLSFLNHFAQQFQLVNLIRFDTEVVRVERVNGRKDQWIVESRSCASESEMEVFQAVVICNGHNSEPRTADILGT